MKIKHIIISLMLLGVVACCLVKIVEIVQTKPASVAKNGKTVLIDPGHGKNDPGAVSANGTRESELNLAVSYYLKEYLEENGFEVVMTRTDNDSLTNAERKKILKDTVCDVVVSIHMNKFSDSGVHGAETFYYSESESGMLLAQCVQNMLKTELDSTNTRTIKATTKLFAVKTNTAPSILVECGYISNPREEQKLNTTQYQRKIAFAIACGISQYCSNN